MRLFRRSYRRRAMTMIEMAVSTATVSIVAVTVAFLTVASAKVSKEGLNMMRSEARVRNGLDLVRRHALAGKQTSIKIENNGQTLRYHDPWSQADPYFHFADGKLNYYPDENAKVSYSISGLNDVVFDFDENEKTLRFTLTAAAVDGNNVTRYLTLEDEIVLRNRPAAEDYY